MNFIEFNFIIALNFNRHCIIIIKWYNFGIDFVAIGVFSITNYF